MACVSVECLRPPFSHDRLAQQGRTPLLVACEKAHKSMVEALLRRSDIDINKADYVCDSPSSSRVVCMSGSVRNTWVFLCIASSPLLCGAVRSLLD